MIETRALRKSFRAGRGRRAPTVEAIRGLDLYVAPGQIFGFLGPNGAGKSTTLKVLATLLLPDAGGATIAGADLLREPKKVREHIGFVPQTNCTYDAVTARQELILQGRLCGYSKEEAQRRAASTLDAFHMTDYADRKIKTYSGGQKRRVDVALGVVHEPRIIFLDEPTAGLDPQSRVRLWEEVRRLNAAGMTVFLTTHYLEEADSLCDRVAIIDHGEIVAEGSPDELKRGISGDVVTVGLADSAGVEGVGPRAAKVLAEQPYVRKVEVPDENSIRVYVDSGASAVPLIIKAFADTELEPSTIELRRPSLDDVFLAKTGRSLEE